MSMEHYVLGLSYPRMDNHYAFCQLDPRMRMRMPLILQTMEFPEYHPSLGKAYWFISYEV